MRSYFLSVLASATLMVGYANAQISTPHFQLRDSSSQRSLSGKHTPSEILAKNRNAVVVIFARNAGSSKLGTGFFVEDSGLLVTNFHVVEGTTAVGIRLPGTGEVLQATKVRGYDLDNDLVALQVEGAKAQSGVLGDSDEVYTGQPVVVVGNPEGLEQTVSDGLISGIREVGGRKLFQISAPVSEGSSGSPVFNEQGEIIAVVASSLEMGQNLNFAIPINYAKPLLDSRQTFSLDSLPKRKRGHIPSNDIQADHKPADEEQKSNTPQLSVQDHLSRGNAFSQQGRFREAEQEYRAASPIDSQDADLYASLSYVLNQQEKWNDAASAAREALRLSPKNEWAHTNLGIALGHKGDQDGEIAEYREALRLNPSYDAAHASLGTALGAEGDLDGEIAEEREALRLNPNLAEAHYNLGMALGHKGDRNAEIAEYREALRLNPKNENAHINLGVALGTKGDLDGAIAEFLEALRLNPKNEGARVNLGAALGDKHDWEGEIAVEREALRLNPNLAEAHYNLGIGLGRKGDLRGALEEYRAAAYMLDPKNATYRQNYERLLQRVNQ